jgi:hypothetical protein
MENRELAEKILQENRRAEQEAKEAFLKQQQEAQESNQEASPTTTTPAIPKKGKQTKVHLCVFVLK